MARRSFDIPEEVRRRVLLQGAEGASWLAGLDRLVAALERAWSLSVGASLPGGSGSLVLEAETADGCAAVLKVPLPWLELSWRELRVLLAADGRGYAKVLRHDEASGAMLLERLGPRLSTLGLAIEAQIEIICGTLLQAWFRPSDPTPFLSGDRKASELAAFIERAWRELGQPCSERTIETALSLAAVRRAAFDPERAVLAHGDAHPDNLLMAGGAAASPTFKFVDPEGLFVEPACDLSVPMREWPGELLEGDPVALGRRRCRLLARLTKIEPQAIWQWGLIERVSTGLHLLELGWEADAHEYLAVAEAWAESETKTCSSSRPYPP
jgi:streptomycin 6-kinase